MQTTAVAETVSRFAGAGRGGGHPRLAPPAQRNVVQSALVDRRTALLSTASGEPPDPPDLASAPRPGAPVSRNARARPPARGEGP